MFYGILVLRKHFDLPLFLKAAIEINSPRHIYI